MDERALRLLRRVLDAIGEDSSKIVVVGGWAIQLYRYLDRANVTVEIQPTLDIDLAVRSRVTDDLSRGSKPLTSWLAVHG